MSSSTSDNKNSSTLKLRTYIANIQGRGGSKIPQLEGRTFESDFIVLNEVNSRQGDEQSISLGCRMIAISDGGEKNKTKGFGTAVMAKIHNPETDAIMFRSTNREVCTIRREVSKGVHMSLVGMYCSPNDLAPSVLEFMKQIDHQIHCAVNNRKDSIVLVGGDPNANIGTPSFNKLDKIRKKYNGFWVINKPTRGKNQPDQVMAFYDPTRFSVSGIVIDGVGDHDAMVIDVTSTNIKSLKQAWVKRKVVVDRGDPDKIKADLQAELVNLIN